MIQSLLIYSSGYGWWVSGYDLKNPNPFEATQPSPLNLFTFFLQLNLHCNETVFSLNPDFEIKNPEESNIPFKN